MRKYISLIALTIAAIFIIGACAPTGPAGVISGELEGSIEEDMILEEGKRYLVTDDLTVSSTLTIEPGVYLDFAADTRLLIKGNILANGTAESPIVFRGQVQEAGYWKGVQVNSSDTTNILEYVHIMHTGSSALADYKTALLLEGFAAGVLNVRNSSIDTVTGYGLFVEKGATLRSFSSNSFSNIDGTPVALPSNQVHNLDSASLFDGETNTNNVVEITGGDFSLANEVTWPDLSAATPYFVTAKTIFDSSVTISAGAIFEMDSEVLFYARNGAFRVLGEADNPVIFRGAVEQAGYWRGIQVDSSDVTNIMQNTVVRHGGHPTGFQGTQQEQANILIEGFSQGYLTLKDSTIADGAGYGVFIEIDATFNEEGANTYNNLTSADVHFET